MTQKKNRPGASRAEVDQDSNRFNSSPFACNVAQPVPRGNLLDQLKPDARSFAALVFGRVAASRVAPLEAEAVIDRAFRLLCEHLSIVEGRRQRAPARAVLAAMLADWPGAVAYARTVVKAERALRTAQEAALDSDDDEWLDIAVEAEQERLADFARCHIQNSERPRVGVA